MTAIVTDATALLPLLKDYFLNRADKLCFAAPWGAPCPTRGDHLLDGLLLGHLLGANVTPATAEWGPTAEGKSGRERGHFRIGSYTPAPNGTTRFGVIDLDGDGHGHPLRDPLGAARAALARCEALGLPAYLERSGSGKGWHLWFFFGPGCTARDVRALLLALVPPGLPLRGKGESDPSRGRGIEVFPKCAQIGTDPWSVGHQVWLPWFHKAKGGRNQFHDLGPNGEPVVKTPTAFDVIDADRLSTTLSGLAESDAQGVAAAVADCGGPAAAAGAPDSPAATPEAPDVDLAEVLSALEALPRERCDAYDDWTAAGMVLRDLAPALATDAELFAIWERWSRQSARFQEGACARHWRSFGHNSNGKPRRTVATLFAWAKEAGWSPPVVEVVPPPPPPATPDPPAAVPEQWPDPIPFDEMPAVPAFPGGVLPAALQDWAEAKARELQVPLDLPAMLGLAVASGALAKKRRVVVRPGWVEHVNLYVAAVLEVGERKTPTFLAAVAPVLAHEEQERLRLAPEIAATTVQRDMLQQAMRAAQHRARTAHAVAGNPKADPPQLPQTEAEVRRQAEAEAVEIAQQLSGLVIPEPPQLLMEDATPESLAARMAAQGGRMVVASDEGAVFEVAKGRYSNNPSFEVWLKGRSGGYLRMDRIGRRSVSIDDPVITGIMCVQPDVIRGLADNQALCRRGFPQRWLYALPASLVGRRDWGAAPAPVPQNVAADYHANMLALWQLPAGEAIALSPQAAEVVAEVGGWLEPQLPGLGDLMRGWANKLPGDVARIAGVLHAAQAVAGAGDISTPVSEETTRAAASLAKGYLFAHARAAFALMGATQQVRDARHILRWLLANSVNSVGGVTRLSRRDIYRGCQARWSTVADMEPALELLACHHYLQPLPQGGRGGPGRKAGPEYLINPRWLARQREGADY
jgi:hypothetical protein